MATLDLPVPRPRRRSAILLAVPPVLLSGLVLALWQSELLHRLLGIQVFQLPLPSSIAAALARRSADLWTGAWYTLGEAVIGLGLGAGVGFAAAALFVQFDGLRRGLLPLAVSANAIPLIAITPIVTRWLGFDQPTRIMVVALMTFAPMVVSAYKGLTTLDNAALDLMYSYAATTGDTFRKLRLPSSLPYVFSALRVGATAAMIGAVVAEFFNSAGGIGKLIANNVQGSDYALAWCGVLIVTGMGLLLYLAISLLERVVVRGHAGRHE